MDACAMDFFFFFFKDLAVLLQAVSDSISVSPAPCFSLWKVILCSCPRQSASGCCAQPLPPLGLFSPSPTLVFLLCCFLITMLGWKVAWLEVVFLFLPPPPLHGNPQLQTRPSVLIWLTADGPPRVCLRPRVPYNPQARSKFWLKLVRKRWPDIHVQDMSTLTTNSYLSFRLRITFKFLSCSEVNNKIVFV